MAHCLLASSFFRFARNVRGVGREAVRCALCPGRRRGEDVCVLSRWEAIGCFFEFFHSWLSLSLSARALLRCESLVYTSVDAVIAFSSLQELVFFAQLVFCDKSLTRENAVPHRRSRCEQARTIFVRYLGSPGRIGGGILLHQGQQGIWCHMDQRYPL